jgi:hypothetical protein
MPTLCRAIGRLGIRRATGKSGRVPQQLKPGKNQPSNAAVESAAPAKINTVGFASFPDSRRPPHWHNTCLPALIWPATNLLRRSFGGTGMLSHCANSQCSKPFIRLGQGRLFLVETPTPANAGELSTARSPYTRMPPRRVERYWLCDQCASTSTLIFDCRNGISIVPLPAARDAKRASARASA